MNRTRNRQLWTKKERRLLHGMPLDGSSYKAIVLVKRFFRGRVVEVRPRRSKETTS